MKVRHTFRFIHLTAIRHGPIVKLEDHFGRESSHLRLLEQETSSYQLEIKRKNKN